MLQNVFLKLINIFVFIVFILVDAFSSSIKTEKSQIARIANQNTEFAAYCPLEEFAI